MKAYRDRDYLAAPAGDARSTRRIGARIVATRTSIRGEGETNRLANPLTRHTLFSSTDGGQNASEWETPHEFFDYLNREFRFTLDPCATPDNAKCTKFFSKAQDGLKQDWGRHTVFLNPPYGREIALWLTKARESAARGATMVALIHARTDTRWFHHHVWSFADEIRFIKGRLKFISRSGESSGAPFPSMIVIYRPRPISLVKLKQVYVSVGGSIVQA